MFSIENEPDASSTLSLQVGYTEGRSHHWHSLVAEPARAVR